jgi:hypothetical protein
VTRRSLLSVLAAVPLLRFLEPLARWIGPAPEVFAAVDFANDVPLGSHITYLIYDDIEGTYFVERAQ